MQEVENLEAISILIDLGALDSYELIKKDGKKILFVTEDTKLNKLKILLNANGLNDEDFDFFSYNGVSNFETARLIANLFIQQGSDIHVIIHRDGDCMTDVEKHWWVRA